MPVHILVEYPELIASVRLGVLEPLKPLISDGICQVVFRETRNIRKENLQWADIVICIRGCEPYTLTIVNEAKRLGRLIVYYLDDDLLHIPQEALSAPYYNDPLIKETMLKLIAMSDILWGVNDKIREVYENYFAGRWICNRPPVKMVFNSENFSENKINILYAGSIDHQKLVEDILSPVVDKLSKEYPTKVSFTFIGSSSGIHNRENVNNISFFENYDEYRSFVENGHFSIGLAPTRTEQFYQCKYYNKFIEYASIGAVGVFTDCELYRQVVVNGKNGFLCDNTYDAWYNQLKSLIEDASQLKSCREFLKRQLAEDFDIIKVTDDLKMQFPELYTFHAPSVSLKEIHLRSPILTFYWGRAGMLWRQYSILAIPIICFKAVKKIVKSLSKGIESVVKRVF